MFTQEDVKTYRGPLFILIVFIIYVIGDVLQTFDLLSGVSSFFSDKPVYQ